MAEKKDQEVNWLEYFKSIADVCPWSLDSYMAGRILFLEYDPKTIAQNDIGWDDEIADAIVYSNAPDDIDTLDEEVYDLNQDESSPCIYFFSHPEFTKGKFKNSPTPIIIQQSRYNLEQIRSEKKH